MNKDQRFNVTYSLNNGEGRTETIKGIFDFAHNPDTYGNGYYMGIISPAEPFGNQGYDIRYDSDFNRNNKIAYIVKFLSDRYDGNNGAWKLTGVTVAEADEDE